MQMGFGRERQREIQMQTEIVMEKLKDLRWVIPKDLQKQMGIGKEMLRARPKPMGFVKVMH